MKKIEFNKEDIDKIILLYTKEDKSIKNIGKIFNCDEGVISRLLRNISINTSKYNRLNLNKDEIIRLYKEELIKTKDIGKIFGCSSSPIIKILRENGALMTNSERKIKLFSSGKIVSGVKINFTEEQIKEIIHLYQDELLNLVEISKVFNVSPTTIDKWLHINNIDTSYSTRLKLLYKAGKIKDWCEGLTKETDVRLMNISNHSKENHALGIVTTAMEKNGRWLGGTSFEPYPITFTKAFKLAIRQRDGFLCLKCGMREEDAKQLFHKGLITHHIDYIKENTFEQNCCALCARCNGEVNSNRPSWTKFFQSMLSERYEYKYSENGDIVLNLEVKNGNKI